MSTPCDGSEKEDSSTEEVSEESEEEPENKCVLTDVMTLHIMSVSNVLDRQRARTIKEH